MKPDDNNGYLRSTVIAEESTLLEPELTHSGTPLQVFLLFLKTNFYFIFFKNRVKVLVFYFCCN